MQSMYVNRCCDFWYFYTVFDILYLQLTYAAEASHNIPATTVEITLT